MRWTFDRTSRDAGRGSGGLHFNSYWLPQVAAFGVFILAFASFPWLGWRSMLVLADLGLFISVADFRMWGHPVTGVLEALTTATAFTALAYAYAAKSHSSREALRNTPPHVRSAMGWAGLTIESDVRGKRGVDLAAPVAAARDESARRAAWPGMLAMWAVAADIMLGPPSGEYLAVALPAFAVAMTMLLLVHAQTRVALAGMVGESDGRFIVQVVRPFRPAFVLVESSQQLGLVEWRRTTWRVLRQRGARLILAADPSLARARMLTRSESRRLVYFGSARRLSLGEDAVEHAHQADASQRVASR